MTVFNELIENFLNEYVKESQKDNAKESLTSIVSEILVQTGKNIIKGHKVKNNSSNSDKIKCTALTSKGKPCTKNALIGEDGIVIFPHRCKVHQNWDSTKKVIEKKPCHAITSNGQCCQASAKHKPEGSQYYYCFRHKDNWKKYRKDHWKKYRLEKK